MGLTLWIVPDEKETSRLGRIMAVRPEQSVAASPASYPKFQPHITLASMPTEYKDKLDTVEASIPKSTGPIECDFTSVDVGSHYFRSVYVTIKLTPELAALHEHVHRVLGVQPHTPLFPHMSLVYIDDADAANGERLKYYEELKKEGKISYSEEISGNEMVSLNCGAYGEKEIVSRFVAKEIWAVLCDGPVESWEVLRKFSLV